MTRRIRSPRWSWARPVAGVTILAVLGWRFGTEAFLAPLGHAARAVVAERGAGQAVQLLLSVAVLLVLPSPVRHTMPAVVVGLVLTTALLALGWTARGRGHRRVARWVRRAAGPPPARGWWRHSSPWVVLASALRRACGAQGPRSREDPSAGVARGPDAAAAEPAPDRSEAVAPGHRAAAPRPRSCAARG